MGALLNILTSILRPALSRYSQFIEMFGNDKWPKKSLDELCFIKSGSTFPVESELSDNGNFMYAKVADMNLPGNEKFIIWSQRYVTKETARETWLPKGAIIFPKRGAAIKTNKKRILTQNTCVDLNTIGIWTKGEVLNDYLFGYISNLDLGSICDDAGIPQINNKNLKPLLIPVPPLPLQEEFASFARQADKSEFDGFKSQFIEMFGKEISVPLPNIAQYSIGLTYRPADVSENGLIVLRSGNIQEGKIELNDLVRVSCPVKEDLLAKQGDILMCSRNGSASLVGKTAIIPQLEEEVTFGAFMTIIRSQYPEYLNAFFQTHLFRDQIKAGKSSTMNQITQKMLDSIQVPFSENKKDQEEFETFARQADKSEYLHHKVA